MSDKVTVDISEDVTDVSVTEIPTSVTISDPTNSITVEENTTTVNIAPVVTTVNATEQVTTVDISENVTTVGIGDASIVASNLASTIQTSHDSGSWVAGASVQASFDNLATTADSRYVNVTGDTMTGNLNFGDGIKATFGNSTDLQMYHSGSHSFITDVGTGNLYIDAREFYVRNDAGVLFQSTSAGSSHMLYADNTKLVTTADGIDVTGTITFDGGTTSADLHFGDDDKALFGPGNELKIYHSANNQSYIHEVGSGDLNILATNLKLHDADENLKVLVNSTGMDVTGTITFDGGTTSNTFNVNSNLNVTGTAEVARLRVERDNGTAVVTLHDSTDDDDHVIYLTGMVDGSAQNIFSLGTNDTTNQFQLHSWLNRDFEFTFGNDKHVDAVATISTSGLDVTGEVNVTGEATATEKMEAPLFKGDLEGAVHFKASGSGLAKGDVVYISGYQGQRTTVAKADASDSAKMPAFGIVNATQGNNNVDVLTFGSMFSLSTTGIATGTELYVSATTPGGYETSAPTGEGNLVQKIAKVVRGDSNSGSIKIMGAGRTNATPNLNDGNIFIGNSSNIPTTASFDTTFGSSFATRSIGDLSNVDITTTAPTNNQVLVWSTDKFVPANQSGAGGVDLTAFSVGDDATANGSGGLAYNNTSGVFTYTPPDLSSYLTSETTTSLALESNILKYTDEEGTENEIDISLYLDDTNLARLTSGTLDSSTGTATFTRTDNTTFTVDFSSLINSAEVNDLSTSVTWANVPNANITESSVTQHQAALSITKSQIPDFGTYLTDYTETDPIVGAINGIVKADGNGTISAAVAGTDYSTLALGTTATTALAGNTTSFGGSASPINLGTHSGTGTQTINIGGAVIGGASTNIKNIYIGNGAHNGGETNVYIGPSSETTTAQTTIYHPVVFEQGTVSFNGGNFTVDPDENANTITLGKTTGTGRITIGQSTGVQAVDIASAFDDGSKIPTVNIAQGGGTRTVNIASDSHSGSTTVVNVGNPSGTANSTVQVRGNLNIDRPMYGNGATEYYDFFDHLGGLASLGEDGDWDISGTGLNVLTEITIPSCAHHGSLGKRGSLRMSCQAKFYNFSSTTKRNPEYYLGLQMKSKGNAVLSENLGAATLVSSPSQFNGLWSFAGNVTDKIVAGFGALANSNSASSMYYGGAPILGAIYDDSVNKTYIRVSSMYYYNNLGGSSLSNGQTTSFDVYYNPTEFKSSGTWVSSLRADYYNSRVKITVQPQSHAQMHHAFNLSIPKQYSKTELRLIFDYVGSNTNLGASVQAIEGTVMLEGSKV